MRLLAQFLGVLLLAEPNSPGPGSARDLARGACCASASAGHTRRRSSASVSVGADKPGAAREPGHLPERSHVLGGRTDDTVDLGSNCRFRTVSALESSKVGAGGTRHTYKLAARTVDSGLYGSPLFGLVSGMVLSASA